MPTRKAPKPAQAAAGDSTPGRHQPVDALLHTADERLFVTTRGQDPELYWLHKYGADDADQRLRIDIRSLYRHEHIEPERLIARLYALKNRDAAQNELFTNELHGNPLAIDELDKPASYYKRRRHLANRLIQGDSLLVMTSLLEREGMAGAGADASTSTRPMASSTTATGRCG
jgi:adenine-specific DNA-methyltransferase